MACEMKGILRFVASSYVAALGERTENSERHL